MPPPPPPSGSSPSDLPKPTASDLDTARATLLTLLPHLRDTLHTSTPTSIPNPLSALHDAASLISAHITRLSLALRPPISVTESVHELHELATFTAAFTAACAAVSPPTHTRALAEDVQRGAREVLAAVEQLVGAERRLVDVGVVWTAVKAVQGVGEGGDRGAVERRVKGAVEIVEDCEGELRGWMEGGGEEGFEDEEWEVGGEASVEMREMAEKCCRRLKTVQLVFKAVLKRRLEVGAEGVIKDLGRLDRVYESAKRLEVVGDLVCGPFHEGLETEDVVEVLEEVEAKAVELIDVLMLGDDGKEDKYSLWFQNAKKTFLKPL